MKKSTLGYIGAGTLVIAFSQAAPGYLAYQYHQTRDRERNSLLEQNRRLAEANDDLRAQVRETTRGLKAHNEALSSLSGIAETTASHARETSESARETGVRIKGLCACK